MLPRRRPRHAPRLPSDNHQSATRSAAWLAGERLFGAPLRSDEPAVPVAVTVRRRKLALLAPESENGLADRPEAPPPEWKGPRVFRVEPASNETVAEPEPEPSPAAALAKRRPRQRIGVDRRPGRVVVQVFEVAAPSVAVDVEELPLAEQLARLRSLMAAVSGALADAQRAAALRFVIEG